MFLNNIKKDEYEFDIFSYSAAINSAIDDIQKDKFGMLNKLSEDILLESLFDKSEKLNKIKQKTLNLLNKEKERTKKAEKLKNTKERKIVDIKIGKILSSKKKYLVNKYKNKDLKDDRVQKEFKTDMTSIFKEVFSVDFSDTEGITEAILLFFIILYVQSFILIILTMFMSGTTAMIVTAVFVAPILEEMAKNYEIKKDNIGNFAFIFNIGETFLYVFGKGTSLLVRIPAIILHYCTSLVQTKIIREDEDMSGIAHITGTIIHALFNTTAIIAGS